MGPPAGVGAATLPADRLATAAFATVRERGYEKASVGEILRRAGLEVPESESPAADKEKVIAGAFEAELRRLKERVTDAYLEAGPWPDSLRAGAHEAARWLLDRPDFAWFLAIGVREAGQTSIARRDEALSWAAGLVDAGRLSAAEPERVPRIASTIAVGAALEGMRRSFFLEDDLDLLAEIPLLMYIAVRPYLGEELARRELNIPVPARSLLS